MVRSRKGKRRLRIAVLLDGPGRPYEDLLTGLLRGAKLVLFAPASAKIEFGGAHTVNRVRLALLDTTLLRSPALDLFIDLRSASGAEQLAMWRRAYFHVLPGGVYAHLHPTTEGLPSWSQKVDLLARRQQPEGEDFSDLSTSTRRVRTLDLRCGDFVAYEKNLRHLYRIHDEDAAELVTSREPGLKLDLLYSVPPETVYSKATVRQHGATADIGGFVDTFDVPELHVWHYRGRIALDTHMLTYRGTSLLPPSFRFPAARSLHNKKLEPASSPGWARLARSVKKPAVTLEGDYFDVNGGYPRMFGHVMTQTIHKLWAWDAAKRQLPGLKALAYIPPGYEPKVEREILMAYGIAADDICFFSEPVHVDSYVSPTIIWEYVRPFYVSPLALETWRRIGRGLGVTSIQPETKLFVSRHEGQSKHRICRNTEKVEDFFRAYGFTIVYPEEHSLAEQAAIFAGARVIGGFGGSAMFNMMYSSPEHVIVLNHESYRVRNEHLYAAMLGSTVDYFWSTPDIPQPKVGHTREAFLSPWEFDFERNRSELGELLEGLQ